jgi:hypothetical protein
MCTVVPPCAFDVQHLTWTIPPHFIIRFDAMGTIRSTRNLYFDLVYIITHKTNSFHEKNMLNLLSGHRC